MGIFTTKEKAEIAKEEYFEREYSLTEEKRYLKSTLNAWINDENEIVIEFLNDSIIYLIKENRLVYRCEYTGLDTSLNRMKISDILTDFKMAVTG